MTTVVQTIITEGLNVLSNHITKVAALDDPEINKILNVIDKFSTMIESEVDKLKNEENKINHSLKQYLNEQDKMKVNLQTRQGKISQNFPFCAV